VAAGILLEPPQPFLAEGNHGRPAGSAGDNTSQRLRRRRGGDRRDKPWCSAGILGSRQLPCSRRTPRPRARHPRGPTQAPERQSLSTMPATAFSRRGSLSSNVKPATSQGRSAKGSTPQRSGPTLWQQSKPSGPCAPSSGRSRRGTRRHHPSGSRGDPEASGRGSRAAPSPYPADEPGHAFELTGRVKSWHSTRRLFTCKWCGGPL
jgi:hypothetical protein